MPDTEIVLDADFDSGSLTEARCRVEGDTVHLAGRDNYNTRRWKWLHFTATGVADRKLTFQIDDNFDTEPARLDNLYFVYSADGKRWSYFDFSERNAQAKTFRFGNHEPFKTDTVTVAFGFPYPYSRIVEHTRQMRASRWVSPTASGDENLVLGMSPGGVDDLGRTIKPSAMFGYQVTDPDVDGPKKNIVLMSGVHPNETLANYVLESLLNWLVGESEHARELRQQARVYVYPMANPDGRVAGYNRSGVQHVDRDFNRFWREDLWQDMPDIATIGNALLKDPDGPVEVFIDLHCWTDTQPHMGILCKQEGYWEHPFWKSMVALEPGLATWDSGWDNPSTETYAFLQLKAAFCLTFELMYHRGEKLANLRRIGRHMGESLWRALNCG